MADRTETFRVVVDGDTAKARTALRGLAHEADRAEDAIDELGDEAVQAAAQVKVLDKQLDGLKANLRAVALEASRTGDKGLLRQLKIDQRDIRQLEGVRKILAEVVDVGGDMAETGVKAGKALGDGVLAGLQALPSQVKGVAIVTGVAFAAVAAPLIGGAIGGAVLGALAGGVVAGGVVTAISDPRVKAAGLELGQFLKATFIGAGDSFRPATLAAIRAVRQDVLELRPVLRETFDIGATFALPLTRGLTGFVRNLLPGLRDGLAKSAPAVFALEGGFKRLGDSIGRAINTMADGASGAGRALTDLFTILSFGITTTAMGIRHLSNAWLGMRVAGAAVRGDTAELAALRTEVEAGKLSQQSFADALDEARRRLGSVESGARGLLGPLHELGDAATDAWRALAGQKISAFEAWTRLGEAITAAAEAAKDGKDGFDIHTAAGQRNRTLLAALAKQTLDTASTLDTAGASATEVGRAMNEGRAALIASAMGMGHSRAAAEKLADALGLIPTNVTTTTTLRSATAITGVQAYKAWLATIPRNITTNLRTRRIAESQTARGGVREFAEGGRPPLGEPVMVGERGKELVEFDRFGPLIHTAAQTRSLMVPRPVGMPTGRGGSTGSPSPRPLNINGGPLVDALFGLLQSEVRKRGGTLAVLGLRG